MSSKTSVTIAFETVTFSFRNEGHCISQHDIEDPHESFVVQNDFGHPILDVMRLEYLLVGKSLPNPTRYASQGNTFGCASLDPDTFGVCTRLQLAQHRKGMAPAHDIEGKRLFQNRETLPLAEQLWLRSMSLFILQVQAD